MSQAVRPITEAEFVSFLSRCRPPQGWPNRIAVATSGGPDSTCLLFLFKRLIENNTLSNGPKRLVALSVNHDAQAASSAMAKQAAEISASLNVRHLDLKLKWGVSPYPEKPKNSTFEATARLARYYALFHAMRLTRATTVAFGHHMDDQIETSLMRLARGSKEFGAAGMQSIRRWGMGEPGAMPELASYGHEGLSSWIVRPLLSIGKDRVLATCDHYNLRYVVDKTNYQPQLTTRNAIRAVLSELNDHQTTSYDRSQLPSEVANAFQLLEPFTENSDTLHLHVNSSRDQFHSSLSQLVQKRSFIDTAAEHAFDRVLFPAPTGTLIFLACALKSIQDPAVLRSLIFRTLRYLSPFPWGSVHAEGHRRQASIDRILQHIYNPKPEAFSGGGGVNWQPVAIGNHKLIVFDRNQMAQYPGSLDRAWMLSRAPPIRRGQANKPTDVSDNGTGLRVDVTMKILDALRKGKKTISLLFDNRFLVTFKLGLIPVSISSPLEEILSMESKQRLTAYEQEQEIIDNLSQGTTLRLREQGMMNFLPRIFVDSDDILYHPKVLVRKRDGTEECLHNWVEPYLDLPPSARWTNEVQITGRAKRVVYGATQNVDWIEQRWIRPFTDR